MEAWLRNWADRLGLHVHLANQTAQLGAINVAGPTPGTCSPASPTTTSLATRSPTRHRRHHRRRRALPRAPRSGSSASCRSSCTTRARVGRAVGRAARGRRRPGTSGRTGWTRSTSLRLEKGHIYLGQDTLPDDHPAKLGLAGPSRWRSRGSSEGRARAHGRAFPPSASSWGSVRRRAAARRPALRGRVASSGGVTSCARSEAAGARSGLGGSAR